MPLPAFKVGESEQLSGGCFAPDVERREDRSVDRFVQLLDERREFEAGLKAEFAKAAQAAGLDAGVASDLATSWRTTLEGVTVHTVDPVRALPNLTLATCSDLDLEWFADERVVITGGIRAATLEVTLAQQLTDAQELSLESAIASLAGALGLGLARSSTTDESVSYRASDVYVGALTSTLKVVESFASFDAELSPGVRVSEETDDGVYTVILTGSAVGDRVTMRVLGVEGDSGDIDAESVGTTVLTLGTNRLAKVALVPGDGGEESRSVTASVLHVGVMGTE
jgi:hypothetical protein